MIDTKKTFKNSTSILSRLNWVLTMVVVSFVAILLGVFISGNFLIDEFAKIHTINGLFDLTVNASDAVEGASRTLTRASIERSQKTELLHLYEVGYHHADESLSRAVVMSDKYPDINHHLLKAKQELDDFNAASVRFFSYTSKYSRGTSANLDLLMAQEYRIELDESLKKTQILTREQGTIAFEKIYTVRYIPLFGVGIITLFCVSYIVISGGASIRILRRSVDNLLKATKEVIGGNLSYQAPILENDEMGWFTFVFNQMIGKVSRGQNSLNRLYSITATLSSTAEPEQVAKVILSESISALNASSGLVVQVAASGMELEKIADLGYETEPLGWEKIPTGQNSPLVEAFERRQAIWIESLADHRKRWPQLPVTYSTLSYVVLPLFAGGNTLGVMSLSFSHARTFTKEEREFCLSIARQCAQALNRAQLYKEAQHAVRIRDDFLSIASHELRTPITPLKLQIQNLLRLIEKGKLTSLSTEQMMRLVGTAEGQINRLTRLVDELLDVTRITSGNLELTKEKMDVSKVIADIAGRFRPELTAIKCDLSLDLEENLMAEIDHSRIEQVVTNLLGNAMRYGAGKPIEIATLSVDQNYIEIQIRDHGMGIEEKDQKRIFNRFERAASTTNFGGLGLGLYIVQQIVQLHQGTISVKSAPGEGATFTVRLPRETGHLDTRKQEMSA